MAVPASLLPELEDVVQHGSVEKRAETLRRITTLFLDGASNFNDDHVALFDDVIGCLIEEIEAKALAELARKLAPVPNAPEDVVRTLAKNDDIAVAGPVLQKAKLDDPELKYIAETKMTTPIVFDSSQVAITYFKATPQNPSFDSPHVFAINPAGFIVKDWTQPATMGLGFLAELDQLITGSAAKK